LVAAVVKFERNSMPNPKRRHTKQRTAKRRSHDFLTPTGVSTCPSCGQPKLPHTVCKKCGEYKGRVIVAGKNAE
jgi:large subunit ribosomal protein L32